MKTVCVITGGGSGMGLAAAKCMPKEKIIVISFSDDFSPDYGSGKNPRRCT